jgi:hypothetical protein
MLVDAERVLLRLKQELIKKNSWGQRELSQMLMRLEVECTLDNDPPSAPALSEPEHEGPLRKGAERQSGMPDGSHPLVAEGATNGREEDATEEAAVR